MVAEYRCSLIFLLLSAALMTSSCEDQAVNHGAQESGYSSGGSDWGAFLACWEREILDRIANQDRQLTYWEKQVFDRASMRYEPASKDTLEDLENRLGLSLPQSYKDFLRETDGWVQIGFDADDALVLPASRVGLLADLDRKVIENWMTFADPDFRVSDERYFVYGPEQSALTMRSEYLEDAIMISEVADAGVYLLNPKIAFADGEYETWFFSWELPGAVRFRSFADLMRNSYILATGKSEMRFPYPEEAFLGTCADHIYIAHDG